MQCMNSLIILVNFGARAMHEELRALADLGEDQGLISSTYMEVNNKL